MTDETPKEKEPSAAVLVLGGTPPLAYLNEPYTWAPTLTGAPMDKCKLTITEGLPPEGMVFANNQITGTAKKEGKFTFTMSAFDGTSSISMRYEIPVEKRPVISVTDMLVGTDKRFAVEGTSLETILTQEPVDLDAARSSAWKLLALVRKDPSDYKCKELLKLMKEFKDSVFSQTNLWVNAPQDTLLVNGTLVMVARDAVSSSTLTRNDFDKLVVVYGQPLAIAMQAAVSALETKKG